MSSLVLSGDTSGQVSLTVPAIAGSNTATIPASTGNVLMDSTVGVCRAWVNFNGVSGSVAIRASFNVSSITRTAAGVYTIAFTNAFTDTNYCIAGSARNTTNGDTVFQPLPDTVLTVSSIAVAVLYGVNGNAQDAAYIYFSAFR